MPRPLVTVALGATVISFAPVLVKLLLAAGVGSAPIAFWRSLVASAVLFGLALRRGAPLAPRVGFTASLLGGLAFALDLFFWHQSIAFVGVGIATVLANTQVFWTATIERLVFGERLGSQFGKSVLVAFIGVGLLTGVVSEAGRSTSHLEGIGYGLATGLCYATYIVVLQRSAYRAPTSPDPLGQAMVTLAWVSLVTAVGSAAISWGAGQSIALPNLMALGLVTLLALLVQVVGWLVISRGLAGTRVSRAALIMLLQPALATVWGSLFLAEWLTPLQWLGAIVALVGIYAGSRGAS